MKRAYVALLETHLEDFPGVVIVGPRQCGKTTLLAELPPGWKRFDLERQSDHQQVARDPDLFLRLNSSRVAIDEGQILLPLFPALRVAIDEERQTRGRFVVTGSSSPDLLSSVSESLAGRVAVIEMAPFSIEEAFELTPSPISLALRDRWSAVRLADELDAFVAGPRSRLSVQEIHRYWFRGGYPEPWVRGTDRFHLAWMEGYVRTYLQRDVARLFPGLNAEAFRMFMQLLAGLSGTIINYADVARALSVSQPTIRHYFQIAHGTFLWRHVPAYTGSTTRRTVRHPRGYLRDSGLLHHLLRIPDLEALLSHPRMGASWEGMVIEQILRGLSARGVPADASYYRTQGGAEIDLVLAGQFGVIPIEVKYGQSIRERSLRSVSDFVREHDCPFGLVVHAGEDVRRFDERLLGVPVRGL
jgi:hypothetical protein